MWRTEDDFGSQFCLPTTGSEDGTQAVRLGGKGVLLPAEPCHQGCYCFIVIDFYFCNFCLINREYGIGCKL